MATLVGKRGKHGLIPKGARYGWTTFRPNPSALQALADCATELAPPAVKTFTLSQAGQAYLHVEQGQPRRAVLLPGRL